MWLFDLSDDEDVEETKNNPGTKNTEYKNPGTKNLESKAQRIKNRNSNAINQEKEDPALKSQNIVNEVSTVWGARLFEESLQKLIDYDRIDEPYVDAQNLLDDSPEETDVFEKMWFPDDAFTLRLTADDIRRYRRRRGDPWMFYNHTDTATASSSWTLSDPNIRQHLADWVTWYMYDQEEKWKFTGRLFPIYTPKAYNEYKFYSTCGIFFILSVSYFSVFLQWDYYTYGVYF